MSNINTTINNFVVLEMNKSLESTTQAHLKILLIKEASMKAMSMPSKNSYHLIQPINCKMMLQSENMRYKNEEIVNGCINF